MNFGCFGNICYTEGDICFGKSVNNYFLFSQNRKEMNVFLNINLFMHEERKWEKICQLDFMRLCICLNVTSHPVLRASKSNLLGSDHRSVTLLCYSGKRPSFSLS